MSIESKLCFFTSNLTLDKNLVGELISVSHPLPPIWVTKYPEPLREWEHHFIKKDYDWFPEPEFGRMEIERTLIAGYFGSNKYLRVSFSKDAITQMLSQAVRENIDPKLHNGWIPMECYLGFGFHDIYEELEHEDGFLFGHATFSCRVSAYGFPSDYGAFREALFGLPEVQEVQKQLEAIAGPLERCFYSVE